MPQMNQPILNNAVRTFPWSTMMPAKQIGNAYAEPPSAAAQFEAALGYRSFGEKEKQERNEELVKNLMEVSRKFCGIPETVKEN